MTAINLDAVQHAFDLRQRETRALTIASALLAIMCMHQIGALGGLVWYACTMAAFTVERLIYKGVLERRDDSKDAEWRIGLTNGAITLIFMVSSLVMMADPRPWTSAAAASILFICLLNSGHFAAISRRVLHIVIAPCLALGPLLPVLGALGASNVDWLSVGLMMVLTVFGMGLVLYHINEKIAGEAKLKRALADEQTQQRLTRLVLNQEDRHICILDREFRLLMASPAFAKRFGHEETEILGRTIIDVMGWCPPQWRAGLEDALDGERTYHPGDTVVRPDGTEACIRWEARPWRDADGQIGGVITFGEDVTAYQVAKRDAEEASQNLRMALRAADAAVWRIDFAEQTMWASPEYAELLGAAPEFADFTAARPSWLLEEDYARYDEMTAQLMRPNGRARIEHRLKTPDDVPLWVQSDMESIFDEKGTPRWIIGMTRNVTERRLLESRLMVATRQAEAALIAKRSMLSELRDDLGAVAAEPVGEAAFEPRDSRVEISELFERFMRVLGEIDLRDSLLGESVTALRDARAAAEAANAAKSHFLASMSHELRTPLNAIIGYSELLLEEAADAGNEATSKDINRILSAARRLLSLINGILDLSKIEAGRMEVAVAKFDPAEIVREAIETARPLADKNGNAIAVTLAGDLGEAESDGFRLGQCLLNLLSNACKFTQDGDITVRCERVRDNQLDWLVFDVTDTGIGMTNDQMEGLFQPFVQASTQTAAQFGGTGLGLSITQRLAELLGGDLSMESEIGKGSSFTLRVPARFSSAAQPSRAVVPVEVGEGPSILVIDDHSDARELVRRAVSRLGLRVIEAHGVADGLAAAQTHRPALIVLDIHLSDGDGWTVLAALRANEALSGIPTLVLSINDDRARAMELGACQHLVKPVERETLAAAVLQFARIDAAEEEEDNTLQIIPSPASLAG